MKPTAESSPEDMSHKGVFLVSLGMRYKGYCANLGRTFIVDPDKVGFHILCAVLSGPQVFVGARVCLQLVVKSPSRDNTKDEGRLCG